MPPKETATAVAEKPTKSYTNWKAFEQCKLAPVSIKCEGYRPAFFQDRSCHSNISFKGTVQNIERHIESDHGGGFRLFLKPNDGKPSPLWAELEASGLEAHDFRCEICDAQLRFAAASIVPHLRAHSGKTRRVLPGYVFNVVIARGKPESEAVAEDEELAA